MWWLYICFHPNNRFLVEKSHKLDRYQDMTTPSFKLGNFCMQLKRHEYASWWLPMAILLQKLIVSTENFKN